MVRPDRPGVRPDRSGQGSGLSGRPDRPAGLRQPCLYASLAYSVAQPHIFATPDCLQVHIYTCIYTSTIYSPVHGTGTSRSGPGLNVCWLIKDD